MRPTRSHAGFTLVELLVAISILALVGVMSYRGLSASAHTQEQLVKESERWGVLGRFFLRFEEDMLESSGFPVRSAAGPTQPGFFAKPTWGAPEDAQILVARPLVSPEGDVSPLGRVGYRHAGGRIERLRWPMADAAPGYPPRVQTALEGVRAMRLQYLGASGRWLDHWPDASELNTKPRGVEIRITLDSGETLTRFFSLI